MKKFKLLNFYLLSALLSTNSYIMNNCKIFGSEGRINQFPEICNVDQQNNSSILDDLGFCLRKSNVNARTSFIMNFIGNSRLFCSYEFLDNILNYNSNLWDKKKENFLNNFRFGFMYCFYKNNKLKNFIDSDIGIEWAIAKNPNKRKSLYFDEDIFFNKTLLKRFWLNITIFPIFPSICVFYKIDKVHDNIMENVLDKLNEKNVNNHVKSVNNDNKENYLFHRIVAFKLLNNQVAPIKILAGLDLIKENIVNKDEDVSLGSIFELLHKLQLGYKNVKGYLGLSILNNLAFVELFINLDKPISDDSVNNGFMSRINTNIQIDCSFLIN